MGVVDGVKHAVLHVDRQHVPLKQVEHVPQCVAAPNDLQEQIHGQPLQHLRSRKPPARSTKVKQKAVKVLHTGHHRKDIPVIRQFPLTEGHHVFARLLRRLLLVDLDVLQQRTQRSASRHRNLRHVVGPLEGRVDALLQRGCVAGHELALLVDPVDHNLEGAVVGELAGVVDDRDGKANPRQILAVDHRNVRPEAGHDGRQAFHRLAVDPLIGLGLHVRVHGRNHVAGRRLEALDVVAEQHHPPPERRRVNRLG
ncbi:serine/threonine-protein phosphatase [Babesia caballi]|uniref:Serine/threonine-protein phosphatase n=1 Tax=Babesia caballi TaxID=5871 RepID=A0AAV4LP34_BABCB|nr:serine/threonine-protein phosphatase [Babesia caballi]